MRDGQKFSTKFLLLNLIPLLARSFSLDSTFKSSFTSKQIHMLIQFQHQTTKQLKGTLLKWSYFFVFS
jgi:hypothetical protein